MADSEFILEKYIEKYKKKPLAGLFCKVVVGVLLIYAGYIHSNNIYGILNFNLFLLALPYILFFSSICLIVDIPDIKGDMKDDCNTFPVKYGIKMTTFISTLLNGIALIISIKMQDPLASTAIAVSFPFFMYALLRGLKKDIIRAIRYPIFILNFYILTIYPLLIFPIIISYYISKYYYWHRFSIHYPTLLVDND